MIKGRGALFAEAAGPVGGAVTNYGKKGRSGKRKGKGQQESNLKLISS
jgi:hypothetical protein